MTFDGDSGPRYQGESDFEQQRQAFRNRHGREPRGAEWFNFL